MAAGRWTVAEACQRIAEGHASPWTAVGDFLDAFYRAAQAERAALIADPPPRTRDPDALRWQAFAAAMVEWLAHRYGLERPAWTARPEYVLREPWFLYPEGALRLWSLFSTPPPFKVRNIFCGDRALDRV